MRTAIGRRVCELLIIAAFVWNARPASADAPTATPIRLPGNIDLVDVDFELHVASLLGRLGCNSAACHGSFQGKGGLHFSLFGQSPSADYMAIVGQGGEERVNRSAPDDSLILKKATGREDHGGGVRFAADSWEYQIFRRWIAEGARHSPDRAVITRLSIKPAEIPPMNVGQQKTVRVFADFTTGQSEEVTSFAEFRSRDESIAQVDNQGLLHAVSSGNTALIVSYRGQFLGIPLTVSFPQPTARTNHLPSANFIDDEIDGQLARLELQTSGPATDSEFLRRASIDVLGIVPTPDELKAFLDDPDPEKRAKKIDSLLHHPRRAAYWATKLCDMTACNVDHLGSPEELRPKRAKMWHDWFRKRIATNMPYDQIVRGVLCAVSRNDQVLDQWLDDEVTLEQAAAKGFDSAYQDRPNLDLFWRRFGPQGPLPVEDLAELTATAFLGVRLHCARCHHHPYDHWSQEDFAGFAKIFARVEYGSSTELRTAVASRLEQRRKAKQAGQTVSDFPRVQEVFVSSRPRELVDAIAASTVPAKALDGPILTDQPDPRVALFEWLTHPDNPYFAANIVNRVWARYFGTGLVEPVDAFSTANPASHPQLLKRLSEEFIRSGYDLRALERLILASNTYQRSSVATGNNGLDYRNLSHSAVRPIMAEALVDSFNQALEAEGDFGNDTPAGSQAMELAVNRFANPAVQTMFRVLGRGDRKSLCECDRTTTPSLRHSLFLMSDPRVVTKIRVGRLARLLESGASDDQILQEFYQATLTRLPDEGEQSFSLNHVANSESRAEGFADIVWALINSREFITNH